MTQWGPRPMLSRAFYKAHSLGNDYLIFEEGSEWIATPDKVLEICNRNQIGRAVQQECRDRYRMPSSA